MYRTEIELPEISSYPFNMEKAVDRDFSLSVFMRMIYSCLVDADYLDTEKFMKNGEQGREAG